MCLLCVRQNPLSFKREKNKKSYTVSLSKDSPFQAPVHFPPSLEGKADQKGGLQCRSVSSSTHRARPCSHPCWSPSWQLRGHFLTLVMTKNSIPLIPLTFLFPYFLLFLFLFFLFCFFFFSPPLFLCSHILGANVLICKMESADPS